MTHAAVICVLRGIAIVLQEPARFGDGGMTPIAGTLFSPADLACAAMKNDLVAA